MDTLGYLKSQGFRGLGHTLHATDDSKGLKRPILLSHKRDRLGVGSMSIHAQNASLDQWWADAFDKQLQKISVGKNATDNNNNNNNNNRATPSDGTETPQEPTLLECMINGRGANKYRGANSLYACFVKGSSIEGTIGEKTVESDRKRVDTKSDKKRKREGDDDNNDKERKRRHPSKDEDEKTQKQQEKEAKKAEKKAAKKAQKREEKAKAKAEQKAERKAIRKAEKKAAKKEAKKEAKRAEKKERKEREKQERRDEKKTKRTKAP